MQQVDGDLFTYTIGAQEEVTIKITPTGVGNFASVNINGARQPTAFSYTMPTGGATGSENEAVMEFEFPGIDDPDAKYVVQLTSDTSGGPFEFSVLNSDPLKEAVVRFTVQ